MGVVIINQKASIKKRRGEVQRKNGTGGYVRSVRLQVGGKPCAVRHWKGIRQKGAIPETVRPLNR